MDNPSPLWRALQKTVDPRLRRFQNQKMSTKPDIMSSLTHTLLAYPKGCGYEDRRKKEARLAETGFLEKLERMKLKGWV
ncbi:MAG: hypothetical protein FWG75_00010 [Cystobacterineae bacterium]|nr:hypothetical protein [Cystobacterineae bacterium]